MNELVWIDEQDAIALHNLLLALYGGAPGVRNHPFVDGNKRTGFVVGVLFLEMNGYRMTAREEDATQTIMGLAAGTIDGTAFAAWLWAHSQSRSSAK